MKNFMLEILFTAIASVISILFIFNPNPYLMFAFAFIAQPLFIVAILNTLWTIYKDLKKNKIV